MSLNLICIMFISNPTIILQNVSRGFALLVDPETSGSVFQSLFDLARLERTAVLIATHNLQLAGYMDRVFALAEGKLVAR